MTKPVVIGVTRFSVDPLSIIGSRLKDEKDLSRRREAVYQPERLASRWTLFNHFTLPSLVAGAERYENYFHLLAYSSTLADDGHARLQDLAARYRWLRLVAIDPAEGFNDVIRTETLSLLSEKAGEVCFNFRIDDDDVLSPDFLDVVADLGPSCKEGQVLSFDLGQYLQRVAEDGFFVHDFDYPKIGIGLGVFCGGTSSECIFDLPVHQKIPDERVLNIRDKAYWIRTLHSHNDSGTRAAHMEQPLSAGEARERLALRFGHLPIVDALQSLSVITETSRSATAAKILFGIQ